MLNVQHLATPIRAQLSEPVPAVELAGRLHPTPAVGGEPRAVAEPTIPALEGLDRGWYAGAVGWTDLSEDGEFCVALRCALLRGDVAHLYAGCGIVADSVPAEEWRRRSSNSRRVPLPDVTHGGDRGEVQRPGAVDERNRVGEQEVELRVANDWIRLPVIWLPERVVLSL